MFKGQLQAGKRSDELELLWELNVGKRDGALVLARPNRLGFAGVH